MEPTIDDEADDAPTVAGSPAWSDAEPVGALALAAKEVAAGRSLDIVDRRTPRTSSEASRGRHARLASWQVRPGAGTGSWQRRASARQERRARGAREEERKEKRGEEEAKKNDRPEGTRAEDETTSEGVDANSYGIGWCLVAGSLGARPPVLEPLFPRAWTRATRPTRRAEMRMPGEMR